MKKSAKITSLLLSLLFCGSIAISACGNPSKEDSASQSSQQPSSESLEGSEDTSEEVFEETSEETSEETENTAEEETTSTEASSTAVNKKMKLTDAVRIRKERSTDSDVLKTAYKNELVKVLENYSDGWSKVDYNGTEGYCKTEFLTEAN